MTDAHPTSNSQCTAAPESPQAELRPIVVRHITFMLSPIVAEEIERLMRERDLLQRMLTQAQHLAISHGQERDRLRAALEQIVEWQWVDRAGATAIARKALSGEPRSAVETSDCSTGTGGVTLAQMAENIKHGVDPYTGAEAAAIQIPQAQPRTYYHECPHFTGYTIDPNYQCAACNGRPPPHGVVYDRPGWLCSVCGGWNHLQDKHCTHTHAAQSPEKAGEKS